MAGQGQGGIHGHGTAHGFQKRNVGFMVGIGAAGGEVQIQSGGQGLNLGYLFPICADGSPGFSQADARIVVLQTGAAGNIGFEGPADGLQKMGGGGRDQDDQIPLAAMGFQALHHRRNQAGPHGPFKEDLPLALEKFFRPAPAGVQVKFVFPGHGKVGVTHGQAHYKSPDVTRGPGALFQQMDRFQGLAVLPDQGAVQIKKCRSLFRILHPWVSPALDFTFNCLNNFLLRS